MMQQLSEGSTARQEGARDRAGGGSMEVAAGPGGISGGPSHLANRSTSTLAPDPKTTATNPASWQAMLNASLYDDDVTTLAPEQREKRAALDALRKDYLEAKVSGGMLDKDEGRLLRERAHEVGTDRMSFADSMYARGMDPRQVHELLEKMRGVDSADPGDKKSDHRDQHGNPLAPASSLSAAEQRLWMDAMATRFDDLHAGYTTSAGVQLPGTPLEKLIDEGQGHSLATGLFKGNQVPPTVGGFFGMASHTQGLSPGARMQTWGLDSDHHAKPEIGYFNPASSCWTDEAAGPKGHVDRLSFETTAAIKDSAAVPMGSAAAKLMEQEAKRLEGTKEYVPEIFAQHSASTGVGMLKHVEEFPRRTDDGPTNPYTGWGFASTRRATDASGQQLGVLDNQELRIRGSQRMPVPPFSRLGAVLANGAEAPLVDFLPDPGGKVQPDVVTKDPTRLKGIADYKATQVNP